MRRLGILLGIVVVAAGCPRRGATPEVDAGPPATPLQRALVLAGAQADDLTLPAAAEAGYTIATSYPIVDAVLAAPLAAGPWADRLGAGLDAADDAAALVDALGVLSPGGNAPPPGVEPGPGGAAAEAEPEGFLRSDLPTPVDALTSARGAIRIEHLRPAVREALVDLAGRLEALHDASADWHADGGGPRTPPRPPEEYFIDGRTGRYRFGTHPIGVQLEFLPDGAALDQRAMTAAAADLLVAARSWGTRLRADLAEQRKQEARARKPGTKPPPPPDTGGPLLHLETTLGAIVVGGRGADRHSGDALLAIDVGGDDVWTNNAGSNFGIPGVAALALDVDGNDRYQSVRPHAQGAGFAGVGVLVDVGAGADGYFAGLHAQGAGFYGVGVLWDDGGDDAYQAEGFAQGAGTFGTGLLVDGGGDDESVVRGRGQGFGSTLGLGALLDLGGDDQRRLGLPGRDRDDPHGGVGQGAGWGTRPYPWVDDVALHGGVGLLYDRAGSDTYYGRARSQGSGWFLALGLLLDRAGDDRYLGEERSQGSGAHLAAGLLVDSGGADAYTGVQSVQGSGDDRAQGLLWDRGDSNDGYSVGPGSGRQGMGRDGQGFARRARALGMLVDEGGDDAYTADRDAMGEVLVPARPVPPPHGVFVDLGGTDVYEKGARRPGSNPADGAAWSSEGLAAGLDTTAADVGFATEGIPATVGPATWDASAEPAPAAPGPRSAAADAFARAEQALRAQLGLGDPPPGEPAPTADVPVAPQRAKTRVLGGDRAGIEALIDTFDRRTEDHSGRDGATLPGWIEAATGLRPGWDRTEARRAWKEAREGVDLAARIPALAALERARFAADDRDAGAMLDALEEAVAAAAGGGIVRDRAARLAAVWAHIHADPESPARHDPALARRLAEASLRWNPAGVGAFVDFAWATLYLDDLDACRRAVEKVALADPDHLDLEVLRAELDAREPGSAP